MSHEDPRYVTDWSALIYALRRQGFTFPQLALELLIPKSTLIGYRDGATPRHDDGEVLLNFYLNTTNSARGTEPKRIRYPTGNGRR